MYRLVLLSICSLTFLSSCLFPTVPAGPSPDVNELIPLVPATSEYETAGYDSVWTHGPSTKGVSREETDTYFAAVNHSYQWDSVGNRWAAITFRANALSVESSGYGSWSHRLIFSPYSDASGAGVIGGLDFLDSGSRYWFTLPASPSRPLAFNAHSIEGHERGFTVGGDYYARLDTELLKVTVPAGTYPCFRFVLSFDRQIGVGALVYLQTRDTLYLSRGVGIVRHTLNERRLDQNFGDTTFYTAENLRQEYNLKSRTTH